MLDVGALLRAAARGSFPQVDGGWDLGRPWRHGVGAVVAFTGHAVVVPPAGFEPARCQHLGIDGFGAAHAPHVVTALAGPGGWVDSLDAVLVRVPDGAGNAPGEPLVDRPDLADHPRACFARRVRDEVRVLGRPDDSPALVTLGRGIGGLPEIGIETDGSVDAVALLRAAEAAVPRGEPVVAAVAPGNARALRTFLAAGYTPVGSVQLVVPRSHP